MHRQNCSELTVNSPDYEPGVSEFCLQIEPDARTDIQIAYVLCLMLCIPCS